MKIKVSDSESAFGCGLFLFWRDQTRFQFPLGEALNGRIKFLLLLGLSVRLVKEKCILTKASRCLQCHKLELLFEENV